jgi:NADH-quinone oxidoreductase subunit N
MNWEAFLIGMLPEHILLGGLLLLIVQAIVSDRPQGAAAASIVIVAGAALASLWLGVTGIEAAPFPGQVMVTPASSFGKAIAISLALPVLLLARDDLGDGGPLYPLLLSSLYGLALMLSSDSFLTLFLALELMSLPVYVLVLIGLKRESAAEAALKYLVLGAAATATLLMGISLLYGQSGTLALSSYAQALGSPYTLATGGCVLVLLAFFMKAAIVPFHAWAPDAYDGASVPVTAYMAAIVKAGVLLAGVRLVAEAPLSPVVVGLLTVLPLASIVWGNLAAMKQPGLRRMLAYSSIAHAGYLFLAFLALGPARQPALLFYLLVYGLMTVLALSVVPADDDDGRRDRLELLQGLYQRQPFAAIVLGLAMLSLAGIPPLPGFVAKFTIFREVMAAGHTWIAVAGLVGSYLGLYFYLRVIQLTFMSPPPQAAVGILPMRAAAWGAALICLVPTLVLTLLPGWVLARLL